MWPEVFRFELFGKELPLRSFGLFVALGFLVAVGLCIRLARRYGTEPEKDPERLADLAWWALIGVVGGGRLGYVIVNLDYFVSNPLEIVQIWNGGLVMYGALILAIVLCIWKARGYGMDVMATADYALSCGFLGLAIGRIGCLCIGDDFGLRAPDWLPWAMTFPDPLPEGSLFPAELAGIPVHPTQLYMSFAALLIFLFGLFMLKRRKFKGQVFAMLLMVYAINRFVIEMFRGDAEARGGLWSISPEEAREQGVEPELLLSTSQIVGLALFPIGVWIYSRLRKREDLKLTPEQAAGVNSKVETAEAEA